MSSPETTSPLLTTTADDGGLKIRELRHVFAVSHENRVNELTKGCDPHTIRDSLSCIVTERPISLKKMLIVKEVRKLTLIGGLHQLVILLYKSHKPDK